MGYHAPLQAIFYMKTLIGFMEKVKIMAQISRSSGPWKRFGKNFKAERRALSRPAAV
jgi:hypothetical protein